MRRFSLALASAAALALATPASADKVQIDPQYPDPPYAMSEALTVGTAVLPYFGAVPRQTPVRALAINCTVAGNVSLKLGDGSTLVITTPVGWYILPLQVIEVNASGTTATATYTDLG